MTLTHTGPALVVRASDGGLYVLPLFLVAYRAGRLAEGSPEEGLARWHLMTGAGITQREVRLN